MLVTMVVGKCPKCGREDSFGNINIGRNELFRGCADCNYSIHIPLPAVSKKVLYLDQFFHSHAFRGRERKFIDTSKRIEQLAHQQLLVCPYSEFHLTETSLWTSEQKNELSQFIKQTARGHKFESEGRIKQHQMHAAYSNFVHGRLPNFVIEKKAGLRGDLDGWDDYFWIDVKGGYSEDINQLQNSKAAAVNQLVGAFDDWEKGQGAFLDDVKFELKSGAQTYLALYVEYVQKMVEGDVMGAFNLSADSEIVQGLFHWDEDTLDPGQRIRRIKGFFLSEHYAQVPFDRISSELFALLRHRVRSGQFKNRVEAEKKLSGIFFDIRFISTCAPYCDAMFVDNMMHEWVTDKNIDLPARFGTKFFSRSNWGEFLAYLDGIEASISREVEAALALVHPPNAKSPR